MGGIRRGQGCSRGHMGHWQHYIQMLLICYKFSPKDISYFCYNRPTIPKSIYSHGFSCITEDGLRESSLGINNNNQTIFFFLTGNQQIGGKHQPQVTPQCLLIAFIQWFQAFPTNSSMVGWQEHWPRSQRPSPSMSLPIANPWFLLSYLTSQLLNSTTCKGKGLCR